MSRGTDKLNINKVRGFLYLLAKWLGDLDAARRGRVGKRIARRAAGRSTGKGLRRLLK
jgi:hypothetical protein